MIVVVEVQKVQKHLETISAHDSTVNRGTEQGVLGPVHVYDRLVNNPHQKLKKKQKLFHFFPVRLRANYLQEILLHIQRMLVLVI